MSFARGSTQSSESRKRMYLPLAISNALLTAHGFPQFEVRSEIRFCCAESHCHVPSVLPSSITTISVLHLVSRQEFIAFGSAQSRLNVGIIIVRSIAIIDHPDRGERCAGSAH